jgi:hypothetical protein
VQLLSHSSGKANLRRLLPEDGETPRLAVVRRRSTHRAAKNFSNQLSSDRIRRVMSD